MAITNEEMETLLSKCEPNHFQLHEVIFDAITRNKIDMLQILVNYASDEVLYRQSDKGKTSLHLAVSKRDIDSCRILMETRLTLFQKDKEGDTPLHRIARGNFIDGCIEAMNWPTSESNTYEESFLEKYSNKKLISALNTKKGETAVHAAAYEHSDSKILRLLLQNGGKTETKNRIGKTPLHFAAENGFYKNVETIFEFINVDDLNQYLNYATNSGETALILAAKKGYSVCCKLLENTNIFHQDKDENTALHYAAQKGSGTIVEQLLILNKDISSIKNKNDRTALYFAASGDNLECFDMLLECSQDDVTGVLHAATRKKSMRIIEKLLSRLEFTDSINDKDEQGNTCLHLAIKDNSYDIALTLLNHGADKEIRNNNDEYPLHKAAAMLESSNRGNKKRKNNLCNILLKRSYRITNIRTLKHETPLHLAAQSGNLHMVKALYVRGARIMDKNGEGLTSIHISARVGHYDTLAVLLSYVKRKKIDMEMLESMSPHPLHLAAENGHMQCCEIIVNELKVIKYYI